MVFGPGLIVTEADNDAGAVSTYTLSGAQYGLSLLWVMLLLLPVCYFIQEMVGRFPQISPLNIMFLKSPQSAILSALIFNAIIIVALIPRALKELDSGHSVPPRSWRETSSSTV
jgi:Mn2+/Fe2+ NRAMP family transporter